jgi:transcriptional regulator with XRE-family HTH domain
VLVFMGKKEKPALAKNIIARREARGWNAETLAEKADVPYPTLRDIEAGISRGRPNTIEAISIALKCKADDLYETSLSEQETALLDLFRQARSDDLRADILDVVRSAIALNNNSKPALRGKRV